MTVILKSDVKASASMGNINGIKGAQDWVGFFDFENESYVTKIAGDVKSDYSLSQVVDASRPNLNGSPVTVDKNGIESNVISVTQPRTALLKNGRFGLLTENNRENFFLNSSTPATQTITLLASSFNIIVSCEGSGLITVTGGVTESGKTITATTPHMFKRSSTVEPCVITLTVSGTLSHAQVELSTGGFSASSKIKTLGVSQIREREKVKIKDNLLSQMLNSPATHTVVVQSIDYNAASIPVGNTETGAAPSIALVSGNIRVLRMRGAMGNGDYYSNILQYISSTSTGNPALKNGSFDATNRYKPYTQSVSVGAGVANAAFNGVAEQSTSISAGFSLVSLELGAGQNSPISFDGICGIITKVVIYDRVLSSSELVELSKSWS